MNSILHKIILFYLLCGFSFAADMPTCSSPVILEEYSLNWPKVFKQEAEIIKQALACKNIKGIEHFGSTSVEGMVAKPVVDIIVGLDALTELKPEDIALLQNQGYHFIENSSYCERYYFQKRGTVSVNLSIVAFGSCTWNACLSVRDYLRTFPSEAQAYRQVKQSALERGYKTLGEYSAYKMPFLRDLVVRALDWWKRNTSVMGSDS